MNEFSHIAAVGLKVKPGKTPRVSWAQIRNRLGQWRYGFALRYGGHGEKHPRYGPEACRVESVLRHMAETCKPHWPWPVEGDPLMTPAPTAPVSLEAAVETALLRAAQAEVLAAAEDRYRWLDSAVRNMLAVVFRDGGHATADVYAGDVAAACAGAAVAVTDERVRADRLAIALRSLTDAAARLPLSTALLAGELAAARAVLGEGETGRPAPQERCPQCNRLVGFCEHTTEAKS